MSITEEEVKLLERKLELLKKIKEMEGQLQSSTLSQLNPAALNVQKQREEEELRKELASLSPAEAMIVLLRKKDITGPFRGSEKS